VEGGGPSVSRDKTKRKHGGSGLLWLNCGAGLVEIDAQH
jgi:hypothetical protein